jgi:Uma2 family endonuclease
LHHINKTREKHGHHHDLWDIQNSQRRDPRDARDPRDPNLVLEIPSLDSLRGFYIAMLDYLDSRLRLSSNYEVF